MHWKNLRYGLGFGLFAATALSVWATIVRLSQGTEPFARTGTGYPMTVAIYFSGFLLGGAILGTLLPLRRWAAGSVLIGFLAILPVYSGFFLVGDSFAARATGEHLVAAIAFSALVGGGLGLWVWWKEQRGRQH